MTSAARASKRPACWQKQPQRHLPRRRLQPLLLHRHPLERQRTDVRRRFPRVAKWPGWCRPLKEDESPYARIAQIFKDRGVTGRVGIVERVRFFVYDGIRTQAPGRQFVSADAVTAGCRMIKSPTELALLQRANDITIEAFRAGLATLTEGMTQFDLCNNIVAAYRLLYDRRRPTPLLEAESGDRSALRLIPSPARESATRWHLALASGCRVNP